MPYTLQDDSKRAQHRARRLVSERWLWHWVITTLLRFNASSVPSLTDRLTYQVSLDTRVPPDGPRG